MIWAYEGASLNLLGEVDGYQEILWTEKFGTPGSFELKIPVENFDRSVFHLGNLLYMGDGYSTMIIERCRTSDQLEGGDVYIVSGSSLERVLDRRVLFHPMTLRGTVSEAMYQILDATFVNPSDARRRWPLLYFKNPTYTPPSSQKVDHTVTGDSVLSIFEGYASEWSVGFNLRMKGDRIEFEPYMGRDFTGSSPTSPRIEFSQQYDNVDTTEFSEGMENFRNFAYVAGEGEGIDRTIQGYAFNVPEGIQRREMYVDARDVRSTKETPSGGTETLTPEEYRLRLEYEGAVALHKQRIEVAFTATANRYGPFVYGDDYSVGDIVVVADSYGNRANARITEYCISDSGTEQKAYPTFTQIG